MGKLRVMVPANEVDLTAVKYEPEAIQAPHLTGTSLKVFVNVVEAPLIGSMITTSLKKKNNITEVYAEPCVVGLEEDGKPEDRVDLALKCLPHFDAASNWTGDSPTSFRYWKIRDYAYAYRSKLATPSMVAERFISAMEEFSSKEPPTPLLISFDAEEVRKQAAASTQRFEEGNSLSILDGIFVAIKDDIDCYPHPSKGGTTWFHEVRPVKKDAVSVSRTTRNPHSPDRYTGGSSSGPAAIVASGLCSAALGTDGGGSVRIPSSLCGVVGLKTTYGRTDMKGSLCNAGTVEIIGPIASNVEDVMLVYAAILGSSPCDRISLKPAPPCLPNLSSHESSNALGLLRLGKYTEWFNDVFSTDISEICGKILNMLVEKHGCELAVPFLYRKDVKLTYDTRTNLAFFRSFTASDYVAAQRLRRRIMYHHMEIFKKVDVIVTPTTGMTAPIIPLSALKSGETNMQVSGNLMRFIIAGNLLGLPAISVPVGYDKQGLPIGLQLIGPPWGEASILRLAAAVEELCADSKKKPLQFYDTLKGN
ncbi:hypothetical protein RHGRI_013884 [Rhododendron griersonianum]|uniref:Amidase domain-containing protein n=2 Tax=Rhododendron griersonianum TaxID=479676 RepID=A0AAV6K778_9ERIC|nr:hypothetical protein RHGRI_013884 [Rhododendron griersonianum]KAG5548333.1 hypothetical protein RHGRI_013884 [Rhododendron griersonianum]